MRAAHLVKLSLVLTIVSVLVGCTSLSAPILEPDRSALLRQALADSQFANDPLPAGEPWLQYEYRGSPDDPACWWAATGNPLAIIPQQRQASFVVQNYGGRTLRGIVTASAPFRILSGEGKMLTATSVAHKVSFSPVTVDVGTSKVQGDLSLARIRWVEQMYQWQPEAPNIDPLRWNQVVQALQLLQSIKLDQVSSWLSSLQRALVERGEDGFREEYNRLFSSYADFPKYVGVVLALRGKLPLDVEPNQVINWRDLITGALAGIAVELIKSLVTPQRPIDVYTWTLMWNLREDFKGQVGWNANAQQLWQEFEDQWAHLVLMLPRFTFALSREIYVIGWNILETVAPWSFGCIYSNCNKYEAMKTLAAFLRLALAPAPYGGIDRLEQAIGTLYALSMFAVTRWHMHGFVVEGKWAAGLAFLPKGSIEGYNKDIILVMRGDHCTDCAAKAKQIVDWVNKAIDHIKGESFLGVKLGFPQAYPNEQPIITLVFTNSKATGIPTVISALESKLGSAKVPIAVMYSEKQANSTYTVKITCIGSQCGELERAGVLEKIRSDYARAMEMAKQ